MVNTDSWLADTKRVIKVGTAVGLILKADICKALGITVGSLIELKIRNTGQMLEPLNRGPKKAETSEVGENPTS